MRAPFMSRFTPWLAPLALVLTACGTEGTVPSEPGAGFDSADPSGALGRSQNEGEAAGDGANGVSATSGGTGSTSTGGAVPSPDVDAGGGTDDPARAIEEADIVKIVGDRLYAMSRYGGISVIDVSDVDHLEVLGRHKVDATPFEMYVRDGVVYALYQGYGEYIYDEDAGTASWVQSSHVVVIDANTPGSMSELTRFAIPGYISDSRIVGDILYVAAFEDGYCWSCAEAPRTTVMSLDVSEANQVVKVDELAFSESMDYSWRRSLSVNDQRMYVAGPTWGVAGPVGSTVQVVDISDPSGDLVEGDSVQVSGQINSRWQMDELGGVLRVISQPFEWDLSVPPKVETFTVASSDELTPLGSLALTLPRAEQLQSVRFDAERAYAITFERTDPLFTIDLSQPAAPVQAGMLEMPGWLYHMEPRGDRLVGLGYDQDNPEGALAVSLFDVSNLSQPVMLSRANFGGDWAWMVEDQDRIHKAFKLFDDAGLIVMPFSGWTQPAADDIGACYGTWVSGIQLIDWTNDTLTARGVAPTKSEARRGLLHDNRLLAVSDERVEAFDISDRSQPLMTSNVALAQYVSQVVGTANAAVRIGQNWYSSQSEIDVTTIEGLSTPRAAAGFDVGFTTGDSCNSYSYLERAFASGDNVYLVYSQYDYVSSESLRNVVAVDVSNPDAPQVKAQSKLQVTPGYDYVDYQLPGSGDSMLVAGEALVFNHRVVDWSLNTPRTTESGVYVVSLTDPANPSTSYVELPTGLGATGIVTDGSVVVRSHYQQSPTNPQQVRFYADRVDVSNPDRPVRLASVNTPGAVIALAGQRAVTQDFWYEVTEGVTGEACYASHARVVNFEAPANYDWYTTRGTCTILGQTLHLIEIDGSSVRVLGSKRLGTDHAISEVAVGDDVLFASATTQNYYAIEGGDCLGCYYFGSNTMHLFTLSGLLSGEFKSGELELDNGDGWGGGQMVASGKRALVVTGWRGQLSLVDATDPEAPTLLREEEIHGYVSDLSLLGSTAVASLGYDGVQTFALDE